MAVSGEVVGRRTREGNLSGELGLLGDRLVHVQREDGRVITSRTRPKLLALRGTLHAEGQPLIDGMKYTSTAALALVREAAGPEARLAYYDGPERFDVLPLSVATDGAIQHMHLDGRRLRPNIVIGGVEDLTESTWPGHRLRIGAGRSIVTIRTWRTGAGANH